MKHGVLTFYGDRPPLQGYRRSFTIPHRRLSHHERAGLDPSDAAANILYSHPSARIVKFTPSTASIPLSTASIPPDTDYPVDTVETLPWAAVTETTIATGPLIIEKVQGSTNFLKSGDVMHAILRNSQCWCVDGVSKFVLRVRKFQYYRIELPTSTPQETEKVEELKNVLGKILRFEITPCPFKRGFHVELPESAITPRRKGQWKRREGSLPSTPHSEEMRVSTSKSGRTWKRRATSDGPIGNQESNARTDPGYGDSPLSRHPHINNALLEVARPTTPSSLASNEGSAGWDEEDPYSDQGGSDQDESPMEHSGLHQPIEEETEDIQENVEPETTPEIPTSGIEKENEVREVALPNLEQDHVEEKTPPMEKEISETPESQLSVVHLDETHAEVDKISPLEAAPEKFESEKLVDEFDKEVSPIKAADPQDHKLEVAEGIPEESKFEERIVVDEIPQEPEDIAAKGGMEESLPEHEADMNKATVLEDISTEAPDQKLDSVASPDDVYVQALSTSASRSDDALTKVSSFDSFHTLSSSPALTPYQKPPEMFDDGPTPVVEHFDPFGLTNRKHKREISELTVTASSPRSSAEEFASIASDVSERPSTPPLIQSSVSESSWGEVGTPSSRSIQQGLRHRIKHRRSLSPLPPASTLFSPSSQQSQGSHLTAAMLQKACTMALVKPIEVMVLLVHILARIAGGATVNDLMSGELFKKPEHHRRNSSLPDQIDTRRDDATDEDDYGVPIRGRARMTDMATAENDDTDSLLDLD